jgi:hypothetical protein
MSTLLPSESFLNSLGIPNKIICDTENEIKSCVRCHSRRHPHHTL